MCYGYENSLGRRISMEQMKAPENIPIIGRELFRRIEYGFMRAGDGKIFFLRPWGEYTIAYPVLVDGSILTRGSGSTDWPDKRVDLVHPRDLGISEIRWADAA